MPTELNNVVIKSMPIFSLKMYRICTRMWTNQIRNRESRRKRRSRKVNFHVDRRLHVFRTNIQGIHYEFACKQVRIAKKIFCKLGNLVFLLTLPTRNEFPHCILRTLTFIFLSMTCASDDGEWLRRMQELSPFLTLCPITFTQRGLSASLM